MWTVLALASLPATALAQGSDDLFAPAPAQPERAQPPIVQNPKPATPEAQVQAQKTIEQQLGPAERDVNLEDRVKAVQRKAFLKTHRFGVTGFGSASMSDAFFQKWGGGGALSFSFSDPFALQLSYAYFHDQETENVLIAKKVLQSQLYVTRLNQLAVADFQWTPVYGKVELLNKIIYFDLYGLVGFGAANGATSWAPASEAGIGERIFLTDFLSVGVEAKYTFYVDQAAGGPSVLQNVLLMTGLVSIWFPGAAEGP